eukprot:4321383-Amphidinium_carterae.1
MPAVTLRLELPSGHHEAFSMDQSSIGEAFLASVRPLFLLHNIPDGVSIRRPDGHVVELEQTLADQGLSEGSLLMVQLPASTRKEEAPVHLTAEDIKLAWQEEEAEDELRKQEWQALESIAKEAAQHQRTEVSATSSCKAASEKRSIAAVPASLASRMEKQRNGHYLPYVSHVWSRLQRGSKLDGSAAMALRHVLHPRPKVEKFYREAMQQLPKDSQCVLLGVGCGSAAAA